MADFNQDDQTEIEDSEADAALVADADMVKTLTQQLSAGSQCLYIPTAEEARAMGSIRRVAREKGKKVLVWDCFKGFQAEPFDADPKLRRADAALSLLDAELGSFPDNVIVVFHDLGDWFRDPSVRRIIRALCNNTKLVNKKRFRPMIIVGPPIELPESLQHCITKVEFKLPDVKKLDSMFEFVEGAVSCTDGSTDVKPCNPSLREKIVECLQGLTSVEAENALSLCIVRHGGFSEDMIPTINAEKARIIRQSEVLTFIPPEKMAKREEIGGFDKLLPWIDQKAMAYSRDARNLGLDYPKGICLVGIPGSGKSMVGKAIAAQMGLPAYIMDVGAVFNKLVGESESRMDEALRTVEAQKGCVLLVDEADKAWGGASTSSGDSGVTRRVFGKFLTWLAEKEDRTFVVMTLNRTEGLPPELLRAGRFDQIFYTDLPHDAERRQIIEIHMRKRMLDPETLGWSDGDWNELIKKTQGFVGAELEQVVVDARAVAFQQRGAEGKAVPTYDEVTTAAGKLIPVAHRDKELIEGIRKFCKGLAVPVASEPKRRTVRRSRSISVN